MPVLREISAWVPRLSQILSMRSMSATPFSSCPRQNIGLPSGVRMHRSSNLCLKSMGMSCSKVTPSA